MAGREKTNAGISCPGNKMKIPNKPFFIIRNVSNPIIPFTLSANEGTRFSLSTHATTRDMNEKMECATFYGHYSFAYAGRHATVEREAGYFR